MRRIIDLSNKEGKMSKLRYGIIAVGVLIVVGVSIPVIHKLYTAQQREAEISRDNDAYRETERKMHALKTDNKYPEAIDVGNEYIKMAKSKHNKAMVYALQGAIYEQWGTNEHALDVYIKGHDAAGEDIYALTIGVARTAKRLDDKERSLIFYKKSLAQLQGSESKAYTPDIAHLKRIISQLESEQNQ